MTTKHRIFWTSDEKDSVLARARQLKNRAPRMTLEQIGTKAQAELAKHRRRPVNNKLTSWISMGLKSGASPTKSSRSKPLKRAPRTTAASPRSTEQSSVVQTLIEHGAAILSGILRHPSVRTALGKTLPGRVSRKR